MLTNRLRHTLKGFPMHTRKPFLLLFALWMALLSLPTLAQRSDTTPAKHTKRHTGGSRARKATVSNSVKVWVNTNTGVYHYPGQRWYGRTKQGEYMTEDEAKKRGFRSTHNGQ